MTPFQQYLFEHQGLVLIATILWLFWVAFALGMICLELHFHNSREEQREFRRQCEDQRKDRK
jgi:hypothetical protein